MKNRRYTVLLAAAAMLIMILDAKTAIAGAREGLILCIRSVIPSLLPFFLLSGILTGGLSGLQTTFLRPLCKALGIPQGSESLFLIGMLGGYPTGAQAVSTACREGVISREDARRMLGFCSNAGPSFVFGFAGSCFTSPAAIWVIWGILILSATATGCLLPGKSTTVIRPSARKTSLADALDSSVKAMSRVCAWVIVFRVILAFCNRWFLWMTELPFLILFNGILELTNGCAGLPYLENEGLRLILCTGMLSFGGICVMLQTTSVTDGLGMGTYAAGKLLQTTFGVLLSVPAAYFLYGYTINPLVTVVLAVFLALEWIFLKKGIAFPGRLLYNPA